MLKKLQAFLKAWRPTSLSRISTQKRCHFHYWGLECQSRKSRNTWSNRQIWLWSTKWSRAKTNGVLPRECTGHIKHPLPTTQSTQYWNQIDYIICSQRWRSSIQSAKTRPGADSGSDHELLFAKFRLKLNKVGKTTRPFRYGINQIPYSGIQWKWQIYSRLDLIDKSAWRIVDRGSWQCTGGSDQDHPQEKNGKGKMVIAKGHFKQLWKEEKWKAKEKKKDIPIWMLWVPKNSKER